MVSIGGIIDVSSFFFEPEIFFEVAWISSDDLALVVSIGEREITYHHSFGFLVQVV